MQFNLIGPFEIITDDGREYAPNAPKIGQMLALLALKPRETVATDVLIRELWGQDPPRSALRTLQTHVYHARKMLADENVTAPDRNLLVTRAPGYEVRVNDDEVDVSSFERFIRRAQWEFTEGAFERAGEHLRRALELWRGPVLSNVPIGPVLAGRIARVEELRIRALELRVETENRLGRQRELLPDLRTLVSEYPLHEWFHGQLIWALHQSGRRGEALQAYRNLYRILKKELGLEPSPDLRRLQAEILNAAGGDAPVLLRREDRQERSRPAPLWAAEVAS
ncbi:AfsR/SARP family transcriptional regulator [Streptomyces sp. SP18CS02]|uniref:AfsR/SARP family transcriptional regulator n=1 Tax=Streptomyces sp. SP18CS02 TaxID=3002531 RepID=UPI002E79D8BB|nr:AfsR/SARP family transcriptional regulator [Streptomyces sp. SP18CS02]MEE1757455.1 AfsR/SARP family transcriptional regulator [Streptomyces sp. SP18CS02]